MYVPPATPLSTNYIQDEFRPCFSPVGSTNHHKEEATVMTVMCWIQYFQHVEGRLKSIMLLNYSSYSKTIPTKAAHFSKIHANILINHKQLHLVANKYLK